ncbi:hypothetical protein INT48_003433 [Thamnidium elegans]|uniref:GAR domain-containing protein n=1 Tax=Thamnidium elegans TaxID=101142 RepID=A0A8H7SQY6_9FUNG|nr:hypothetical protein INT48_003433 [Thamnidium elegans]
MTLFQQSSLFNWVNLYFNIASIEQFKKTETLVLFIQSIFNNTDFKLLNNDIPLLLNEISSTIPVCSLLPENVIDISAYLNGDENQILAVLSIVQAQYQAFTITHTILQNKELSFTFHNPQFIPDNLQDVKIVLFSWSSFILSDYVNASLIPPLTDFTLPSWKTGIYLLAIIHYHNPHIVPDMFHQQYHLSTTLQMISENYHVPALFDPLSDDEQDESAIIAYLVELVPSLFNPTKEKIVQRHKDIERFKNSSITTFTSTFSLQKLNISKTTVLKYGDVVSNIPNDLEYFESKVSILSEKLNNLNNRLLSNMPTRRLSSSVGSLDYSLTDDSTTASNSRNYENSSILSGDDISQQHQQQMIRVVHPLQATEEDYAVYDRNFKILQSEFQTLTDGDFFLFQNYIEELDSKWENDPLVVIPKTQLFQLHQAVLDEFEKSDINLSNFRRGFAFGRMCISIRQELDVVQNKMLKSITTHYDVQELETRIEKTTGLVETLQTNFNDLITMDPAQDACYFTKFESISSKNLMVKNWVEEVRIWFAEAERIEQWIKIHIEKLESITLPDQLGLELSVSYDQVQQFNATYSLLEKEIDSFNEEDMARLRSHVKTLTGSGRAGKDLSPADTTTIEITLTTLATLDKLMHSLRKKNYDLQLLTQRVSWEEEYIKTVDWLDETKTLVDNFLEFDARWKLFEGDITENKTKREQFLEKEKQKEAVIQQLLMFEKKVAAFDLDQFTKTINHFQYLDSISRVELPHHLKSRQMSCEQSLEDLMKCLTFTRNVVEQRLNVMDFLYQTEAVFEDAELLKLDLSDTEINSYSRENDRELTARIQIINERVSQLVTVAACRIPYPTYGLGLDKGPNTTSNEEIQQVITEKCDGLILLSEDLDDGILLFRDILQLYQYSKEYLDSGIGLCDWADDRLMMIQKAKINIYDIGSFSVQDLQVRERDLNIILDRLNNGKENEAVELLTRIQSLLESGDKLNAKSLDREGLIEISQNLEEKFDRLHQNLKEHELDLQALRKKMEDGNCYLENNHALQSFVDKTRQSIPGLKQTCGFITGQSEKQDKHRLDMFTHSLDKISTDCKVQQAQFDDLCSSFILIEHSRIENIEEIRIIQQALENDWILLGKEINDLKVFFVTVGEWYDRQRRLSMVEKELLGNINEEIICLVKTGWEDSDLVKIQQKINEASVHLKEIGLAIRACDIIEDPLQTANYSRARDRHNYLTNKVLAASNNLHALKYNANKAMAYSLFLSDTDKLLDQVQEQTNAIIRRLSAVGTSKFSSQSVQSIDLMFKSTQSSNVRSEKDYLTLAKQLKRLFIAGKELESEGHDSASSLNIIKHIKDSLNQLSTTIGLEKKQIMFIRKVEIHAKAANDLQIWINHCSNAITQLPEDASVHDLLSELDSLEQKMDEMKPTLQAFKDMESRIFITKDGLPLDLYEINLDKNEIKEAIRDRRTGLLELWDNLEKQHQQALDLMGNSKRNDEVSQRIKFILTKLDDMKDRVSAIRIFRSSLDTTEDACDLQSVRSCSLTSIPTEHRLASAKAELNILDRDIISHLLPAIKGLDNKLDSINQQSDTDTLSSQRTEITVVMQKLTELMENKRTAITEAEKMGEFLIVMEELDVLLLALAEVISRADPSNARIVDENYNRSDLQILLIDLDTRYQYYNPKISELLDEFKQVAENLMDDLRVVDSVKQSSDKWAQLKAEAAARKAKLTALINSLGSDHFDTLNASINTPQEKEVKTPTLVKRKSIPRYMANYTRTKKTSVDSAKSPSPTSNKPSNGTVPGLVKRTSMRQIKSHQQNPRAATKTPENYVSDPQNVLDVALGDILNDSPYKIQVKMVPGEVGKYWFGNATPKLAYCRVLRSRMVMVRVGGGWVELSQFLSDHALLEGGNFVPGRSKLPTSTNNIARDGFLNTTTMAKNMSRVALRGGNGSPPLMKESYSTHTYRGASQASTYGHGIKTGNKFLVTLDSDGNRVEVKMTKATSNNSKFTTPRRMNV